MPRSPSARRPTACLTALQRLLDGMRDAALVLMAEGQAIAAANRAAGELSGCTAAELVGVPLSSRCPDAGGRLNPDALVRDADPSALQRLDWLRSDGSRVAVEATVAAIDWAGGPALLLSLRDSSAQARAEAASNRRLRQQAAVAELGQHALATADLDGLLNHAVVSVQQALDVEYVSLLQVVLGDVLLVRAGAGLAQARVGSVVTPDGRETQAVYTLHTVDPVVSADLLTESRFQPLPDLTERHGLRSGASVAVRGQGMPFGVLAALSTRPQAFDGDDVHFLHGVANVLAAAIERQHAEEERERLLAREEEALAEAEINAARFRALADAMPQIVWTANPDGWLDYYNQRWFDYTGMTLAQTEGWGWQPVLHPDDVQRCIDVWSAAVESGEPYEIEYRFKRASDGVYRWHLGRALPVRDALGQIVKWFGTCTDIDDQKRLADELRASRDQLSGLFGGVHDAIVMRDAAGKLVLANDAAARLYGWPSAEALLSLPSPREQLGRIRVFDEHGAPLSAAQNPTRLALRGVATPDRLLRIRSRETGDERIVLARSAPVRDATGKVAYVVTTLHDVTAVKHAEEAARAARDELDAVLHNMADGITVQTPDGDVVFANEQAARLLGYPSVDALRSSKVARGQDHIEIFDEAGARFDVERLPSRRVLAGEPIAETLLLVRERATGAERWLEIKAAPLLHDDGSVRLIIVLFHDVTARRAAADAVRRSRDELDAILRGITDGILVQTLTGELLYVNETAARIMGYPSQEALRAAPTESRLRHMELFDENGEPFPLDELPNRRIWRGESYAEALVHGRGVLGVERWVMIKAVPLRDDASQTTAVITVLSDVTERRRAEEEIRRSRDELDTILHGIADGLYVQSLTGEMRYANQAAAEMLGYDSPEELINAPLATRDDRVQILDEHGDPFPLDALPNRRVSRGEPYAEALVRARYRDGGERWGIVKAVPLRDGGGTPNAVIVVLNDITERRRAEELQRQAENLSRSNAALQEFAYVASHDLQEPLRMVASYTQLLQRRYRGKLDSDADEFIGFAVDGAQRMKQLISDLLAYSRVETQGRPPALVDVGAVVADTLENLRVAIDEAGAEIQVGTLPVLSGDRTQIGQLLQNLLGNAIKFRGQRPPRISVSARWEAGEWLFTVEDNGIGVPPEFAERVFGAFQRLHTRDEYEGSGIGLAVCKKIVERHGGRIWVEPVAGGGARFCFTLPALATAA